MRAVRRVALDLSTQRRIPNGPVVGVLAYRSAIGRMRPGSRYEQGAGPTSLTPERRVLAEGVLCRDSMRVRRVLHASILVV